MIEDQIRYTQDIRRAALKQGKSVLQPLDRRGNINHAAEPLIFNSREDALAHQRANRHTLFSLYAGLLPTVTKNPVLYSGFAHIIDTSPTH